VEQRGQLPVPEPGGRVRRIEIDGSYHHPHVRHPVADAVVPVRARHAVPDRPGGRPRHQAGPMLGVVGGRRARRYGPQRPVPERQHVQLPGRDGQSAVGRVRHRAARRAVLHAVVHAHGEAVQPVAGHRTTGPPQTAQGGHVRAPPGRPA